MHAVVIVVIQLGLSLLAVGVIMPAILYVSPTSATPRTGLAIVGGLLLAIFIVFRIVWPQPRRE